MQDKKKIGNLQFCIGCHKIFIVPETINQEHSLQKIVKK